MVETLSRLIDEALTEKQWMALTAELAYAVRGDCPPHGQSTRCIAPARCTSTAQTRVGNGWLHAEDVRSAFAYPVAKDTNHGLRPEQAKALIEMVMGTRDQEMTCDECVADIAEFEVQLTGKPLSAALQAVQEHLDRCHDCADEYHVLRQALAALAEEEGR